MRIRYGSCKRNKDLRLCRSYGTKLNNLALQHERNRLVVAFTYQKIRSKRVQDIN